MAEAKPKRDNHNYVSLEPFSFDADSLEKLAAIGITDPALIKKIEKSLQNYLLFSRLHEQDATSSQVKAAIVEFEKATEAMIDALNLDSTSRAHIRDNFFLDGGNWQFFLSLEDNLWPLLNSIRKTRLGFEIKKGKPEESSRKDFALSLANLLKTNSINPTTYKDGKFYQCLKFCLQAAGDIPPDSANYAYEPDISRLVELAVKEIRK